MMDRIGKNFLISQGRLQKRMKRNTGSQQILEIAIGIRSLAACYEEFEPNGAVRKRDFAESPTVDYQLNHDEFLKSCEGIETTIVQREKDRAVPVSTRTVWSSRQ